MKVETKVCGIHKRWLKLAVIVILDNFWVGPLLSKLSNVLGQLTEAWGRNLSNRKPQVKDVVIRLPSLPTSPPLTPSPQPSEN